MVVLVLACLTVDPAVSIPCGIDLVCAQADVEKYHTIAATTTSLATTSNAFQPQEANEQYPLSRPFDKMPTRP
jgi:hypothetical protein